MRSTENPHINDNGAATDQGLHPWWASATAVLLGLALIKVIVHFATNGTYGYFRDEFYYIACSDRLAWGYVDHPPLSLLILKITRMLIGDSIFAIRLPVVLCGAANVFMTGLIAREMGGGRFAQGVAALCYLIMGVPLGLSSFFSMNAFDHTFWIVCMLIVVRIFRMGESKLWLLFGAVAGVGMLNKVSIGFFGFGIVVGLLLTSNRRQLATPWIWAGGAIALLIFLPHIVWQYANDWPTLQFIENGKADKNTPYAPLEYLAGQLIDANPLTLPVWLAGLGWLLFARNGGRFRPLAIAYIAILILFIVQHAKSYYLAAAYPMLFAGGAMAFEAISEQGVKWWLRPILVASLVVGGIVAAPMGVPVLEPEAYLRYQTALGFEPPREEAGHDAAMPQHFADRFGWKNMVEHVAKVNESLPPEDRERCTIFCGNYGEAGAVDFFGPEHGLPNAVSVHNNYWLWGPGDGDWEVVIVVGWMRNMEDYFEETELAATAVSEFAEQDRIPIYICRRPTRPVAEIWSELKLFI